MPWEKTGSKCGSGIGSLLFEEDWDELLLDSDELLDFDELLLGSIELLGWGAGSLLLGAGSKLDELGSTLEVVSWLVPQRLKWIMH